MIKDDEVEIMVEQAVNGTWTARALHRASATIKISDMFDTKDEAIKDAMLGLVILLEEKQKGLGEKK
ncbi:MAG: hypothetical protein KDD70_11295 [Bdellovibrionales bacterium]|nr:hypothetical protein [Bdellovibrionales bacterium]